MQSVVLAPLFVWLEVGARVIHFAHLHKHVHARTNVLESRFTRMCVCVCVLCMLCSGPRCSLRWAMRPPSTPPWRRPLRAAAVRGSRRARAAPPTEPAPPRRTASEARRRPHPCVLVLLSVCLCTPCITHRCLLEISSRIPAPGAECTPRAATALALIGPFPRVSPVQFLSDHACAARTGPMLHHDSSVLTR